jgi:transposase
VVRPLIRSHAIDLSVLVTPEKSRIRALLDHFAAIEPGAVASEVARAAGIHASQLFRWRQELCDRAGTAPVFAPVAIAPGPGATLAPPTTPGAIEIEFAARARMRLMGPVNASTLKAMVTVLAKARRR